MNILKLFSLVTLVVGVNTLSMAQNTYPWPSTGNVGIGTSTPSSSYLLDVRGDIRTTSSLEVGGGDVFISRTSLSYGYVARPNLPGFKNLAFAVMGGGPLDQLSLNSNTTFTAGNLGVGTNTPSVRLEVSSPDLGQAVGNTTEMARFAANSGNNSQLRFYHYRYSAGTGWNTASTRIQAFTDVDGQGYIDFNPSGGLYGMALGTSHNTVGTPLEIMRLCNNGNVGIGTTNPGSNKLAVEGTIGARKVVVSMTTPFPDYVFKKEYHLTPLDSIAKYVEANNHLPEMPSAEDVQKNGLDLGGNQALLLKKIEELTLYMIEQQKRMDALTEENRKLHNLQEQINELKDLLKK